MKLYYIKNLTFRSISASINQSKSVELLRGKRIKRKCLFQLLTVESLLLMEVTWKSEILLTERDKSTAQELPIEGL